MINKHLVQLPKMRNVRNWLHLGHVYTSLFKVLEYKTKTSVYKVFNQLVKFRFLTFLQTCGVNDLLAINELI